MTILGNEIEGKNIVIIGWPTSGKTHLTNFLAPFTDHVIIHTDDYQERIGDFKQELYVLLDDLKAIHRPVIVEGILGYRLLRKGVELNCFYPHIVIELITTFDKMKEIYLAERPNKDYLKCYNLSKACDTILQNYKGMVNPSPPIWLRITKEQTITQIMNT